MKSCFWAACTGGLIGLMLMGGPARPARAQAVNLALTATASASSVWEMGTDFAANKANDGDPTTRWNSASGDQNDSWLQLDWKTPQTFNKVAVDEDFNRVTEYNLEVPNGPDPANPGGFLWKPIYASMGTNINPSNSGTPTYTVTFAQPVTTSTLRFHIVTATTVPSIFEFRVYNVPLGTVSGAVTDSNGAAIPGALVSIGGTTATTDAMGKYTATVEAGTVNLTAGLPGSFRNRSALNVNVAANMTTTQNFSLLTLPTNLAKTATADASTYYQMATDTMMTYGPAKANDGDIKTRWNSDGGDIAGSWLSLAWTAPQTFNTVTIREALGRITDYTIQTSTDGSTWTDAIQQKATASGSDRVLITTLPAPITTKYLRILINAASNLPSIYELEATNSPLGTISGIVNDVATGKPVAGASVNLAGGGIIATTDAKGAFTAMVGPDQYQISATGAGYFDGAQQIVTVDASKTVPVTLGLPAQGANLALMATASDSSDDGTNVAANVNDGDPMTAWMSDPTMVANQWIAVTFKQATTFNVVNLVGFKGVIQKSDIQYLDTDGKTWVDVPKTSINPETLAGAGKPALLIFDKPVTSTAVRYFINYTNSMTNVPGLSELQVYNSPIGQTGGTSYILGNPTGSGTIGISDATLVLQYVVKLKIPSNTQFIASDVDKDGDVSIKDVTKILQAIVNHTGF